MADERTVTISFEDAQRIFDLAVGADQMCSGYMETDDVHAMRRLAVAIGVDPAVCTSAEFVTHFPHAFKPSVQAEIIDWLRGRVQEERPDSWHASNIMVSRPETDDEVLARVGTVPLDACSLHGRWGVCGKPAEDQIHSVQ